MQQLVKVTQGALAEEETGSVGIQQRNLISDSLRYLNQHEAALVKGYPMALLEIFAEGPAVTKGRNSADDTGMDFGELSLMDENEMLAQVELSKAQQSALHATDAVLAELNPLVSAAQGLRSVQPERNPLRPESYIRALQRVVSDTGVSPEVRQLWMQHMRDLLGKLLVRNTKAPPRACASMVSSPWAMPCWAHLRAAAAATAARARAMGRGAMAVLEPAMAPGIRATAIQ